MYARWLAKSAPGFLAVAVVVAGLLTSAPGTAAASNCVSWTGVQPPNPGAFDNRLFGVAALSSCDAWAVGNYFNDVMENFGQTLIEHWNGSSWTHVPSPNPGGKSGNNTLLGVAAISRTDAWAVGDYSASGTTQALIEHWDGTAWQQVPSASVSFPNILTGVAAVSATDVWAVGEYFNNTDVGQTLIEHWDGAAWTVVPSPNPGGPGNGNFLSGVAATAAANVWAVGGYVTGAAFAHKTLILHWNGAAWQRVPSPNPSPTSNMLNGVSASSATDAWAVGRYENSTGPGHTLIEHWNGTAWTRVPSPDPSGTLLFATLNGVAAISSAGAWAVGDYENSARVQLSLIEHWNGTAWRQVPSPDPSSISNLLNGVSASSAANIWAVGERNSNSPRGVGRTFAIHCC
jgi:hypothetical protein